MKTDLKYITNVSAASLLALTALGQDSLNQPLGETNSTHQDLIQTRGERWNGAAKATDIMGMSVNNLQDEKLGKVSDLAVDMAGGRVVAVIISTGGFLGMGNTLTAVPPGALQADAASHVLKLDATKEKFNAAPRFDAEKWDESTQSNQLSETYGYYGQHPYFARGGYGTNTLANTLPRNMDGSVNTLGARQMDTAHNLEVAGNAEQTNSESSITNLDGTSTRTYQARGYGSRSWGKLGSVQKASKLMGTPVRNLQDENLGKVENLALDLSAGRIVAVIVSSGGFMGIDNALSAVPPTALTFNSDRDTFQLDASKESLASSPHFQENEWPDLNQSDYFGGVYRAYHVEPYFTGAADNTRRNVRDRDSRTLTPLDQGNSQADVDTTAQIRKEIIADSSMTTNAKNVKIITQNGHVTLRGPVNTAEEKNRIGEIANRIASAGNVDNQLEVANTPNNP